VSEYVDSRQHWLWGRELTILAVSNSGNKFITKGMRSLYCSHFLLYGAIAIPTYNVHLTFPVMIAAGQLRMLGFLRQRQPTCDLFYKGWF
jgi:hypothetical protein